MPRTALDATRPRPLAVPSDVLARLLGDRLRSGDAGLAGGAQRPARCGVGPPPETWAGSAGSAAGMGWLFHDEQAASLSLKEGRSCRVLHPIFWQHC